MYQSTSILIWKGETQWTDTIQTCISYREKARNGNKNGTSNLHFKILQEHNIKKQHFHGGIMNGVCDRWLMDNVDPIFHKIWNLMLDKLKTRATQAKKWVKLLTQVLEDFHSLFEVSCSCFTLTKHHVIPFHLPSLTITPPLPIWSCFIPNRSNTPRAVQSILVHFGLEKVSFSQFEWTWQMQCSSTCSMYPYILPVCRYSY